MELVAKKELHYAGRTVLPGARFEASDKDAKLLKLIGKAGDVVVEPKANPTDLPTQRKEEVAEPAAEVKEVETPADPEPVRGVYQRRDMQAEPVQPKKTPGPRGRAKRSQ